jgi:ketosteroid isomerase-like protein
MRRKESRSITGGNVSESQNIQTIKTVYEAFGRGDVDAIIAAVSPQVDWGSDTASNAAPWYGKRRGIDGVASFFTDFGGAMEVEEFTPLTFAANGEDVLTVVRFRARSRATGKVAEMQLHHWFHFSDGKIDYYRGTEDTAITAAALTAA